MRPLRGEAENKQVARFYMTQAPLRERPGASGRQGLRMARRRDEA
jgi:hypothetical protein